MFRFVIPNGMTPPLNPRCRKADMERDLSCPPTPRRRSRRARNRCVSVCVESRAVGGRVGYDTGTWGRLP